MLAQSTYDDLSQKHRELSAQLEVNPLYRDLQALKHVLDMHERERSSTAPHNPWKERNLLNTPEEREAMVNAAERHMVMAKNRPITIKQLAIEIQNVGVSIKGKHPGTTLGATLSARAGWKLVDKKHGLWQMTDEAFAAARATHQFTSARPHSETAGAFRPAA